MLCCAVPCWAGLGWNVLCYVGLGWAGLECAVLRQAGLGCIVLGWLEVCFIRSAVQQHRLTALTVWHGCAVQGKQVRKASYVPDRDVDYNPDSCHTCTVYAGTVLLQVSGSFVHSLNALNLVVLWRYLQPRLQTLLSLAQAHDYMLWFPEGLSTQSILHSLLHYTS